MDECMTKLSHAFQCSGTIVRGRLAAPHLARMRLCRMSTLSASPLGRTPGSSVHALPTYDPKTDARNFRTIIHT